MEKRKGCSDKIHCAKTKNKVNRINKSSTYRESEDVKRREIMCR
jgi:hypothetical protein